MLEFRIYSLLSALFGGLTAILAKQGLEGVPPNLALAVRVVVILIFALGIATYKGETDVSILTSKGWFFLSISGIATGMSWLCYFHALQLGPISQVAPIDKLSFVIAMVLGFVFLGEVPTKTLVLGAIIICVGVLITLQ